MEDGPFSSDPQKQRESEGGSKVFVRKLTFQDRNRKENNHEYDRHRPCPMDRSRRILLAAHEQACQYRNAIIIPTAAAAPVLCGTTVSVCRRIVEDVRGGSFAAPRCAVVGRSGTVRHYSGCCRIVSVLIVSINLWYPPCPEGIIELPTTLPSTLGSLSSCLSSWSSGAGRGATFLPPFAHRAKAY